MKNYATETSITWPSGFTATTLYIATMTPTGERVIVKLWGARNHILTGRGSRHCRATPATRTEQRAMPGHPVALPELSALDKALIDKALRNLGRLQLCDRVAS